MLTAFGSGLVTAALPRWDVSSTIEGWRGPRARDVEPGTRIRIEARDTVTSAPELVRATMNMAMAHTDSRLSYLGDRLVPKYIIATLD